MVINQDLELSYMRNGDGSLWFYSNDIKAFHAVGIYTVGDLTKVDDDRLSFILRKGARGLQERIDAISDVVPVVLELSDSSFETGMLDDCIWRDDDGRLVVTLPDPSP